MSGDCEVKEGRREDGGFLEDCLQLLPKRTLNRIERIEKDTMCSTMCGGRLFFSSHLNDSHV